MGNLFRKIKRTDGFIAIMALGIFSLLTIFGVIIQATITNTFDSVKNTNNYYAARDMADSMAEYLEDLVNTKESGFNKLVTCSFGTFDSTNQGSNDPACSEIAAIKGALQNLQVAINIKGRSTDTEKFKGDCPGIGSDCYVVPFPGTGDSGDRCQLYNPVFEGDNANNQVSKKVDNNGQINDKDGGIPQLDYSCNWNKLTFGSSSTDRVAIPFYYDTGTVNQQTGAPVLANPFLTGGTASNFVVRIRPPCLPFAPDVNSVKTGETRAPVTGGDPTICDDSERYVLDEEDDNLIVQWQLTGLCGTKNEQCGMIEFKERKSDESLKDQYGNLAYNTGFSGITEKRLNGNDTNKNENNTYHGVLFKKELLGLDTSSYGKIKILENIFNQPAPKLPQMSQPVLTLFLNEKLITTEKKNIPYLEYQVLTDKPIGDSQLKINVSVNVNGNLFEKTVVKKESKDLIDFAVQN